MDMGMKRLLTTLLYKKINCPLYVVLLALLVSPMVYVSFIKPNPGYPVIDAKKSHAWVKNDTKDGYNHDKQSRMAFKVTKFDPKIILFDKIPKSMDIANYENETVNVRQMPQIDFMHKKNLTLIMVPDNLKTPNGQKWNYNVNSRASDNIPLNRESPDLRWNCCTKIQYDVASLPSITIIIPFYNEVASLLLRTLHAIFARTPLALIHEVILVDDCSSNTNLKQPLEDYLKNMVFPIRLFRNKIRQGLIRTRQRAADNATGEVLVFLDSHIEVGYKWSEPLLRELRDNPRRVLQPGVTSIDKNTLEQPVKGGHGPHNARTAFSWDLKIRYLDPVKNHANCQPYKVPSFLGCAMAVRWDFFHQLGGFNTAMDLWGGENFELGFQAWLCGDGAYTVPCSRVGHVFRPLPYADENKDQNIVRNLAKVAEVWMGNYSRLFYAALKGHVRFTPSDRESIAQRRELKQKLNCSDFSYILQHVTPDLPMPSKDAMYFGMIYPAGRVGVSCVQVVQKQSLVIIHYTSCHHTSIQPYHMFSVTHQGLWMHANSKTCVSVKPQDNSLSLAACRTLVSAPGRWVVKRSVTLGDRLRKRHSERHILYVSGTDEYCVTRPPKNDRPSTRLFIQPCTATLHDAQTWQFSLDLD